MKPLDNIKEVDDNFVLIVVLLLVLMRWLEYYIREWEVLMFMYALL